MESGIAGDGIRPVMPLFFEAALLALTGFAAGLLVAYLVSLRRRRQD